MQAEPSADERAAVDELESCDDASSLPGLLIGVGPSAGNGDA